VWSWGQLSAMGKSTETGSNLKGAMVAVVSRYRVGKPLDNFAFQDPHKLPSDPTSL